MQLILHPGYNILSGQILKDSEIDHPKHPAFLLTSPDIYALSSDAGMQIYKVGDFVDWIKRIGFEPHPLGGFVADVEDCFFDCSDFSSVFFKVAGNEYYVYGKNGFYFVGE